MLPSEGIMKHPLAMALSLVIVVHLGGCYMYRTQAKALVPGVDVDQTLEIAEMELRENKTGSVLTYWAVRDQVFTGEQAKEAGRLYFKYIDKIDSEDHKAHGFSVWHFTWAVSNIYRFGNGEVKRAMHAAWRDAAFRVEKLDMRMATKNFSGEKMLTGDAHFLGRSYAKKHVVVPGNKKYVQSVEAYRQRLKQDD